MSNRRKVILQYQYPDSYGDNFKLILTEDQIQLLNFLLQNNVIDPSDWNYDIFDDDRWVEV